MKKHLLLALSSFAFLLLAISTQAQESKIDSDPVYQQFNDRCILDKVEYKQDRTIFHFRYKASSYTSIWLYSPDGDHPWFLKDEINGEEYNLLGVYNVRRNNRMAYKEVTGNHVYMNADSKKEKTYFECEVHFERMPEHVSEVDLIEGKGMESAWNHFNCFDIKITPLKKKQDLAVEPIEVEDIVVAQPVDLFQEPIAPLEPTVTKVNTNTAQDNNNQDASQQAAVVQVTQTEMNWSVFPTPATHVLNVKQSDVQVAQLSLVTVTGQVVWNGRIQGTLTTIDVSEFAPGAYFLQHTVNGNTTAQKVLIKK